VHQNGEFSCSRFGAFRHPFRKTGDRAIGVATNENQKTDLEKGYELFFYIQFPGQENQNPGKLQPDNCREELKGVSILIRENDLEK